MKKRFAKSLLLICSTLLLGFQITSCDKENKSEEPENPDNPGPITLILSASELQFNANGDEQQTVNIQTNGNWSARADADWIDISPKSGSLNGSITITVNSPNESSQDRESTVYVSAGEREEEICVKQKALLQANCNVTPTHLVSLAYGIAFFAEVEKNVAYFQFCTMETSQVSQMTDTELVAILDKTDRYSEIENMIFFNRTYYDPTKDYWFLFEQGEDYTLLMVAHDNSGNRGDLNKIHLTPKSAYNQPMATLSELKWDNNEGKWTWETTMDSLVKQYYQYKISINSIEDLPYWDPTIAAFYINYYVSEEPERMYVYTQSGSWSWTPTFKPYIIVFTWAQNQDGEWAGILDYQYGTIPEYSSGPKEISKYSYKKLGNQQLKMLKDTDFEIIRIK